MSPTAARAITAGLIGSAITATLMTAALVTTHDPTRPPAPSTTTVTTPVAPCHHEDCPPWPSLDY